MKRNVLIIVAVVLGVTLAASAGTISGQVSGVAGQSVVYVDAISGKTFPPPAEHPVIDQRGLVFSRMSQRYWWHYRRLSQQRQRGSQRLLDFHRR